MKFQLVANCQYQIIAEIRKGFQILWENIMFFCFSGKEFSIIITAGQLEMNQAEKISK